MLKNYQNKLDSLSKNKKALTILIVILYIISFTATTYFLIQPAISAKNDDLCSVTEHIHSADCFETICKRSGRALLCSAIEKNENISHIHDSFCYDDDKLICPLEEIVHIHDENCCDENGKWKCTYIVHQHDESCFAEYDTEHSYSVMTCGMPVHHHTSACYNTAEQINENVAVPMEYENQPVYEEDEIEMPDLQLSSPEILVHYAENNIICFMFSK